MFTGLIREMATVMSYANNELTVGANYQPNIGDSIAINGACLTVVKTTSSSFTLELSPETQSHIETQNLRGKVHIEPAMTMGDRFEGHIVQGHVDCIGEITQINNNGNSTDFFITIPDEFQRFLVPKGSITVDGVSLTINELTSDGFRLTIIPHTMKESLFASYTKGYKVNIETDMFARYVFHLFKPQSKKAPSWDDISKITALY
ncbi:riboflavin synthase [Sulfurimonas sp. MAG313]|nr:riboflavin synthase [Sulfurimonas sp. MAG313]MDF1881480.1 riboflavin synthase [Sulfurimonas sp. MAG313]